jgi:2Fe-2S ferredoxin
MPWIHFGKKNRESFEVAAGTNLMESLLNQKIPVSSSCHGDGVCAKCRVTVQEGDLHLSPKGDLEKHLLEKNKYAKNVRISCQVQVLGDVTIDTGYW